MLIREVVEAKASAELCKSNKPNSELGASQLASCKSQGLRARDTKRKYKIRGKTASIDGKKIRGGKYGGSLPEQRLQLTRAGMLVPSSPAATSSMRALT